MKDEFDSIGVLCLSQKWNEPLMWSHYADQHRGICIGFETSGFHFPDLKNVNYNASRQIRLNDLYRWKVKGISSSKKKIIDTYFYSKSPQWGYEKEWRDLSETQGVQPNNLKISSIYFGVKCDPIWIRAIVKILNKDNHISLRRVHLNDNDFDLTSLELNRTKIENERIKPAHYETLDKFVDEFDELIPPSPKYRESFSLPRRGRAQF